jgi:hypothetical protein
MVYDYELEMSNTASIAINLYKLDMVRVMQVLRRGLSWMQYQKPLLTAAIEKVVYRY